MEIKIFQKKLDYYKIDQLKTRFFGFIQNKSQKDICFIYLMIKLNILRLSNTIDNNFLNYPELVSKKDIRMAIDNMFEVIDIIEKRDNTVKAIDAYVEKIIYYNFVCLILIFLPFIDNSFSVDLNIFWNQCVLSKSKSIETIKLIRNYDLGKNYSLIPTLQKNKKLNNTDLENIIESDIIYQFVSKKT